MVPSRYDWKIVDWDVKPQHNQPTNQPTHWVHTKTDQAVRMRRHLSFRLENTSFWWFCRALAQLCHRQIENKYIKLSQKRGILSTRR